MLWGCLVRLSPMLPHVWCLAALDRLPVVPSLAFAVVSLVLARHWAGGSLNDGYVTGGYRLRLMEQILIIWGIVEFNAPAQASGETSVPLCDRPRSSRPLCPALYPPQAVAACLSRAARRSSPARHQVTRDDFRQVGSRGGRGFAVRSSL